MTARRRTGLGALLASASALSSPVGAASAAFSPRTSRRPPPPAPFGPPPDPTPAPRAGRPPAPRRGCAPPPPAASSSASSAAERIHDLEADLVRMIDDAVELYSAPSLFLAKTDEERRLAEARRAEVTALVEDMEALLERTLLVDDEVSEGAAAAGPLILAGEQDVSDLGRRLDEAVLMAASSGAVGVADDGMIEAVVELAEQYHFVTSGEDPAEAYRRAGAGGNLLPPSAGEDPGRMIAEEAAELRARLDGLRDAVAPPPAGAEDEEESLADLADAWMVQHVASPGGLTADTHGWIDDVRDESAREREAAAKVRSDAARAGKKKREAGSEAAAAAGAERARAEAAEEKPVRGGTLPDAFGVMSEGEGGRGDTSRWERWSGGLPQFPGGIRRP